MSDAVEVGGSVNTRALYGAERARSNECAEPRTGTGTVRPLMVACLLGGTVIVVQSPWSMSQ